MPRGTYGAGDDDDDDDGTDDAGVFPRGDAAVVASAPGHLSQPRPVTHADGVDGIGDDDGDSLDAVTRTRLPSIPEIKKMAAANHANLHPQGLVDPWVAASVAGASSSAVVHSLDARSRPINCTPKPWNAASVAAVVAAAAAAAGSLAAFRA